MGAALIPGETVIGILYPGELGAALAEALQSRGYKIITTLNGRSLRTRQICSRAGISVKKRSTDVVRHSDIILSTVSPEAAYTVAAEVRREADLLKRDLIYIDANSVSPQTIRRIADEFRDSTVSFIDVAIHGQADRLSTQGTLFASGPSTDIVAQLFEPHIRVRIVGNESGNASLLKMTLGGMSKGVIGLFLQSSLLAHRAGVTEDFCDELARFYPDVLRFVERSLPTYSQHSGRRAQEMCELAETLRVANLPADLATALSSSFARLDASDLASICASLTQSIDLQQLIALSGDHSESSAAAGANSRPPATGK